jgi:hypothetical protein
LARSYRFALAAIPQAKACGYKLRPESASILRRRPAMIECSEDIVQIGGDANLIFKKIVEPEVFLPFGQSDEGQEVAQTYADLGFLASLVS